MDTDVTLSYPATADAASVSQGSTLWDADATSVISQHEHTIAQALEQARDWFKDSLTCARIGFFVSMALIALLALGLVPVQPGSVIASLIFSTASALFFLNSRAANGRVDKIRTALAELRRLHVAIRVVSEIEDPQLQDRMREAIAQKILTMSESAQSLSNGNKTARLDTGGL